MEVSQVVFKNKRNQVSMFWCKNKSLSIIVAKVKITTKNKYNYLIFTKKLFFVNIFV